MPMRVTSTAGGEVHPNPFVGPINHTVGIRVDVSTLTTAEVDADGYIRPGVLLKENGALADATANETIYGAVVEATKIADDNVAGTLAAADDVEVPVAMFVLINRDILEDSLGRAVSANELAALARGGSHVVLTPT